MKACIQNGLVDVMVYAYPELKNSSEQRDWEVRGTEAEGDASLGQL
jgi:hypothetical protein